MAYLKDVINTSSVDALSELFASYDATLEFADSIMVKKEDIHGFLGMIGFSGEKLKGNVSIWAGADLLTQTGSQAVNKSDWIAEIANQFIGRVKNKLLQYNIEIFLGTPTSIETGSLILNFIQNSVKKYRFVSNGNTAVLVFVDAVFDESLVVEECSRRDDLVAEGDMLLF